MVLRLSVSGPVVAMAISTALCAGKTRLLPIVVGEYPDTPGLHLVAFGPGLDQVNIPILKVSRTWAGRSGMR